MSGDFVPKWSVLSGVAPNPMGGAFQFPEEPWVGEALCAQTDPEKFFPEQGESSQEAKRTCGMCPVTDDCLKYALEHGERFGIWGGLSALERRKLERTKRAPRMNKPTVCGTPSGCRRHYRLKETPCTPCREAAALEKRCGGHRDQVESY